MEKYGMMEELGRGASGIVFKAVSYLTGEVVAVKRLNKKFKPGEEGMISKDINAHMMMNNHPNIITLKETIKQHEGTLFLVYEYMPRSLYQCLTERKEVSSSFPETEIRFYCFQVFQVLAQMHQNGYFHCDLEPKNLLLNKHIINIDDLGQARETIGQRSSNVSKLWYRAPEVLLQSPNCYNYAVDMWAMGAIMVELFTLQPLFQGDSPVNVLSKMWNVLGTPPESAWSTGLYLASRINNQFPDLISMLFFELLPNAGPRWVNLIATLLSWKPSQKPTADQALKHPLFHSFYASEPTEPVVFELALQREELRKRRLEGFTRVPQRVVSIEEQISMLPENPFDM